MLGLRQRRMYKLPISFLSYSSTPSFLWSQDLVQKCKISWLTLVSPVCSSHVEKKECIGFWNSVSCPPLLLNQEAAVVSYSKIILHWWGVVSRPPRKGWPEEGFRDNGRDGEGEHLGYFYPIAASTASPAAAASLSCSESAPSSTVSAPRAALSGALPPPECASFWLWQSNLLSLCLHPRRVRASCSHQLWFASQSLHPLGSQFPQSNSFCLKDLSWFLLSDWTLTNAYNISQLKGALCPLVSFLFLYAQPQGRLHSGSYYILQTMKKREKCIARSPGWRPHVSGEPRAPFFESQLHRISEGRLQEHRSLLWASISCLWSVAR